MTTEEFEEQKYEKFGQTAINNEESILERLKEVELSFYNRLESKKLIKKQGRVPFTEHMTIVSPESVVIPEELAVQDDIKREVAFYNVCRGNVMKGMQFLIQSKVPISRPDDFFAEMFKSDDHMGKVKSRLLKQSVKIKTFEEKKLRAENKKFHRAIKDHKMKEKHSVKRDNMEAINKLKSRIQERSRAGDDVEEAEFNKIMLGNSQKTSKTRVGSKVIDVVRAKQQEHSRKKNQFKHGKDGKGGKGGKGGKPDKK